MTSTNANPCACPAYPFPHREGGGDCEMPGFCGQAWDGTWEDCFFAVECGAHAETYEPEPFDDIQRNQVSVWIAPEYRRQR